MTDLLLFLDESTERTEGPEGYVTIRQLHRYDALAAALTRRGLATDVTESDSVVADHGGWVIVHGMELLADVSAGALRDRRERIVAASLARPELVEALGASALAGAIDARSLRLWSEPGATIYGRREVVDAHPELVADDRLELGSYIGCRALGQESLADPLALYLMALRATLRPELT